MTDVYTVEPSRINNFIGLNFVGNTDLFRNFDNLFISIIIGGWLYFLLFFIFNSYFQYKLSKKLDVKYSWMAWVPFLSFFNFLSIAGKSVTWGIKWSIVPISMILLVQILNSNGFIPVNMDNIIRIFLSLIIVIFTIAQVILFHRVSIRTGHGGWWTIGLLGAGWLFWPVTALHYEKGDETIPRPFIGLKKFLLIFFGFGLTILITLATVSASLFPVMTDSLQRSRDVARIAHMTSISTTLSVYYSDKMTYPKTSESGCLPIGKIAEYAFGVNYIDPVPKNIMPGCDGTDGTYAYRSIPGKHSIQGYIVGVKMESKENGNSNLTIDKVTPDTILKKGSGQYYYVIVSENEIEENLQNSIQNLSIEIPIDTSNIDRTLYNIYTDKKYGYTLIFPLELYYASFTSQTASGREFALSLDNNVVADFYSAPILIQFYENMPNKLPAGKMIELDHGVIFINKKTNDERYNGIYDKITVQN